MLASDIEKALKTATGFTVTTVREVSAGVFVPEAANPAHQAAIDAALPGVIQALQDAETVQAATRTDFSTGVQTILNRLDTGIAAVASDKTDLAAAGNLAAAKTIVDRMLNRENALYTDLKKVIKRLEQLAR